MLMIEHRVVPPQAIRFVRKMKGGCQAHLLETDDGDFYVVKFLENPQGKRILVNEWLASHILQHLGVATPAVSVIQIGSEFLKENPDVFIQLAHRKLLVAPGVHFGSRFPGHPDSTAVYDLFPSALLGKVANRSDFLGALALDRWMANTDCRQAIFHRNTQGSLGLPGTPSRSSGRYLAEMVDFSMMFDGQNWEFSDRVGQGVYRDGEVYAGCGVADLEQWTAAVRNFSELFLRETAAEIPATWREVDGDPLARLLDKLLKRRCLGVDSAYEAMRLAIPHLRGHTTPAIWSHVRRQLKASPPKKPMINEVCPWKANPKSHWQPA